MKKIDYHKLKKVRELEHSLTGSHERKMYEKESHRARKNIIEGLLLKYKDYFLGGNILDYGCAEGAYCEFMRNAGFKHIFGCDISTLKIDAASKKLKDVIFFDLDKINDKIKYQLILCLEVLQHIPDYILTLDFFKNILSEKGYLLISIPNLSRTKSHEFANIDNQMTEEELLKEIGGAGFGRQNAVWRFNSKAFFTGLENNFDLIELKEIDTPDGQIKNLWTVGLLRKK